MAEDKTIKVYVDEENEVTYVPFPSHFITDPGQHEHLQQVKNEGSLITELKDYGRQNHRMDDGDDYILEDIQDD